MVQTVAPKPVVDTVANLCKRRGFIYPCGEIYGGTCSIWDYGLLSVELRENIKRQWWKTFVTGRKDAVDLDSSIILPRQAWEASDHVTTFTDPLMEFLHTHKRYRADHLLEACEAKHGHPSVNGLADVLDPGTGQPGKWTEPQISPGLMRTYPGSVDNEQGLHYMRPETAQGISVSFKNVMTMVRVKLPFDIGQTGKASRDEIIPGNFILRTREFERMEIEYFVAPDQVEEKFNEWVDACWNWFIDLGVNPESMRQSDIPKDERAHYSARTIGFECRSHLQGNERGEPMGVASHADYGLGYHIEHSKEDLRCHDQVIGEKYAPYITEPSFGLTRTLMTSLCDAYAEEGVPNVKGGTDIRTVLKLGLHLSPARVVVLSLSKRDILTPTAEAVAGKLHQYWAVDYDTSGTIGRRYRRQDETGTPFCVTADLDTLEDSAVAVYNRDTMEQECAKIDELEGYLAARLMDR